MKHNSITTIKCRFSNQVNKMINPYFGVKRSNHWKKKVVKLTDEEKQEVEKLVNKWINDAIDVECLTMSKTDAINSGAECMFIDKYPDIVTVYKIGDISMELCGGPHVKNTSEIGEFTIKKEEASSAGVRRIKAIIK